MTGTAARGVVAVGALHDAAECSVSASKTSLVMAEYQATEGGGREAVLLEAMVPRPDLCYCCVHPLKTVPSPA